MVVCRVERIEVEGGERLLGEVVIHGSKNAVLPIMAAAVLNKGMTVIHNCPVIADVEYMSDILRNIGCLVTRDGDTIAIDAYNIDNTEPKESLFTKLRASVLLMGTLLGRCGEAVIPYPGGCKIGMRPIDLHILALKTLGADVKELDYGISARRIKLSGNVITFSKRSVGATQNAVLAAVYAEGTTIIKNAATEPEVTSLLKCLNGMGAKISGIGTDTVKITGVKSLHDVVYEVESDRIVAGTYVFAAAITGGNVALRKAPFDRMRSTVYRALQLGCGVRQYKDTLVIEGSTRIKPIDYVRTRTYPGFPTDMQSQLMSVLALADGKSVIREEIFENRFTAVKELVSMGADIRIENNTAVVTGVTALKGTTVTASDLRQGAALVIAGLAADGRTIILNSAYINRGYVDICKDLKGLGAKIRWLKADE